MILCIFKTIVIKTRLAIKDSTTISEIIGKKPLISLLIHRLTLVIITNAQKLRHIN